MPRKKKNGVGATCSVLIRFLHPRQQVVDRYPNASFSDRLDGLIAQRRILKKVSQKDQIVILFRHDNFPNLLVHTVERYAKVLEEGPACDFFHGGAEETRRRLSGEEVLAVAFVEPDNQGKNILQVPVFDSGLEQIEKVARLVSEGYTVDDDNDPAPENCPTARNYNVTDGMNWLPWGSRAECQRQSQGHRFENPRMIGLPATTGCLDYFMFFLPPMIREIVLVETNKQLDGKELLWGEFVKYLGLWLLMSTVSSGCARRAYWAETDASEWSGAPFRFHQYMSYSRFEAITKALRYTDTPIPQYQDKFCEVRDLIHAWNQHMKNIFIPSWMSCLDESMSSWTRKWTCPGFMYVPRKPHPMGNEYHSIACGLSGIMFAIELVEGKDAPNELKNSREFKDEGKTAGTLLRLCKGIFSTGKVVILDSGFCVLEAIIELKKKGVFASAMIKKRRYWPKHVKGDDIKERMKDKEVGTCERLPGILNGIYCDLYALKEPDYILMMMSTYGSLIIKDGQHDSIRLLTNGQTKRFKYTEVVANHFMYRGAVDQHNAKRHDCGTKNGLSLEDTWVTNRWENNVFAFILAITEVNAYCAMSYFTDKDMKQLEFRKKVAHEMVFNTYDICEEERDLQPSRTPRTRSHGRHVLTTAPPFSGFVRGNWKKKYKNMYQQHVCTSDNCRKRIRTVCSCDRSLWLCTQCFSSHCIETCTVDLLDD